MKHQVLDANAFGWDSGANLEKKSFTLMGLAHCVLLRCPYAQGVLSEQVRVLSERISELT